MEHAVIRRRAESTRANTRVYAPPSALSALLLSASAAGGRPLFVTASAPPGGDGQSWATAFASPHDALAIAAQGGIDTIWIAEGTYTPVERSSPGDPRSVRFALAPGVTLYGGFAGDETSLEKRNPTLHPTILSGDLAGDDGPGFTNVADNAYHVVTAASLATPVTLDGLVIRGGNASGAADADRRGGAMHAIGSTVILVGCRVESNRALQHAGGARLEQCTATFANCIFEGNQTSSSNGIGGAIGAVGGSLTVEACMFTANSVLSGQAGGSGGAIGAEAGTMLQATNCSFEANVAKQAGIYVAAGAYAIVQCEFSGNIATASSTGAAFFANSGQGSIVDCVFTGNSATGDGGAVRIFSPQTGNPPPAVVTIDGCAFLGNSTLASGGALALDRAAATVTECVFVGNSSGAAGGALWVALDDSTTIKECWMEGNVAVDGGAIALGSLVGATLEACTIRSNIADETGGGLWCGGALTPPTTALLDRCRVERNIAVIDGGGMYWQLSGVTLRDSAIVGNRAILGLGGALCQLSGSTTLQRCTVAGNEAATTGGAHLVAGAETVHGSIVWFNVDAQGDGFASQLAMPANPAPIVAWSCIAGLPGDFPGPGNVAADPAFVDLDGADGLAGTDDDDLALSQSSPCINRGDPAPGLRTALDLDGGSRIQACRVDIGAIESALSAATPVDCNGNGVADECDVADGVDGDCDVDGLPNSCEIAAGAADCDADGIPDACQLVAGGFDCDGDGIVDSCAVATGLAADCNGTGVPDACEIDYPDVTLASPQLPSIGAGQPKSWTFVDPPTPTGDVTLSFAAKADLNAAAESIAVSLNGMALGTIFGPGGSDCPTTPDVAALTISAAAFLLATGGGDATVLMTASAAVNPLQCSGGFIQVTLLYHGIALNDLDNDGILDSCEMGDLDGDNMVGGADLGLLLAAWGSCGGAPGGCAADLNGDGAVDGGDLGILLSHWN